MYKVLKTYSTKQLKEHIETGRSNGGKHGIKLVKECEKELKKRGVMQ